MRWSLDKMGGVGRWSLSILHSFGHQVDGTNQLMGARVTTLQVK